MHKIRSTFLKKWVRNTFWGWLVGVLLIIIFSLILEQLKIGETQFFIGFGLGLGVGFMQWTSLKKIAPISRKWIWLTAFGMGLPFILLEVIPLVFKEFNLGYSLQISIAIGSIITAIFQKPLIRRRFPDLKNWEVLSFFGWTVGGFASTISDFDIIPRSGGIWSALLVLLTMLSGGLILGILSGKSLGIEDN